VLTGPDQVCFGGGERRGAVGEWGLQDGAAVGPPQDRLDADVACGIVEAVLGEFAGHRVA